MPIFEYRYRTECNPPRPAILFMRLHYNFNVTIKTCEEPISVSVNRILSEVAFKHPRHLGLRDTHDLPSPNLSQFTFIDDPINLETT